MTESTNFRIFTLHIEGVNIDNIPLHEIGEYIADLAQLLGKEVEPKFAGITKGSINLKAKVPTEREIDVKTRGFLLRTGDAPEDAIRARQRIAQRLGKHRAKRAVLVDSKQAKVIELPILRPQTEVVNVPLLQKRGTLQGQIIRIGGRQETVSVEIQDVDEHIYPCRARREIARRLAKEIFGSTVRVHGTGRLRLDAGVWRVEEFHIEDFDVLEDEPLSTVLSAIRNIQSEWKQFEDPISELDKIRRGE